MTFSFLDRVSILIELSFLVLKCSPAFRKQLFVYYTSYDTSAGASGMKTNKQTVPDKSSLQLD